MELHSFSSIENHKQLITILEKLLKQIRKFYAIKIISLNSSFEIKDDFKIMYQMGILEFSELFIKDPKNYPNILQFVKNNWGGKIELN